MASFNADILLNTKVNQQSLNKALAQIQQVQSAVRRIKPINLLAPGAGAKGDAIRKSLQQILQVSKQINAGNVGPGKLSSTFAGASSQASVLAEVLANTNLNAKESANTVRILAEAFGKAEAQANRLKKTYEDTLRVARGLQPLAERQAEVDARLKATEGRRIERARPQSVLGSLESNAKKEAFYARQREKAERNIANASKEAARAKEQELRAARKLLQDAFKLEQSEDKRTRAAIRRIDAERDATQRRRRQDILTGVGFSALFAGGPSEILAGGVGAAAGGLGGSLIGSAVGRSFDNLIRGAAELGAALDPLTADIDRVAAASGLANTKTVGYIKALEEVTTTAIALEAAASLLADRIGKDGVDRFKTFGDEVKELGNAFNLFITNIGSGITGILNPALEGLNRVLENLRLQGIGERIIREGGPDADRIRAAGAPGGVAGLEAQRDEIRKILKEREEAIKRSADAELSLDERVNASLRAYELQNQVLKNRLEYEKELEKLNDKERQEAAKEAREAAAAQREMLRMLQTELNLRNQIQDTVTAANEARIGIARLTEGEQAAIALERQQAANNLLVEEQRIRDQLALDLQAEGANATLLNSLANEKIRLLQVEKQLIDEQLSQREKEYLLGLALYKLQTTQQQQDFSTRLGRNVEDAQTRLGSFGDSDALARNELRIKQARRLDDELQKLFRTEQQLVADRKKATDPKQKGLITERIQGLQAQRTELEQTLPVLNELEMQNLKLQQSYAKIKPITDEVVGGLLNGIQAVVAGTKTAEEAFADFLNSIAQLLLKTAAEMIATYIAIGIAKQFAGLGSTSTTGVAFAGAGTAGGVQPLVPGFNESGGRTMANMPYVVGEKGAELFVPGKTGTMVPADVFEATRQAIAGNGPEGGDSDAFAQNSVAMGNSATITKENTLVREMGMRENEPIDIRYESTVINEVSYVSEEQFQKGLKTAVAQSKSAIFGDLKNKPRMRAGVGL